MPSQPALLAAQRQQLQATIALTPVPARRFLRRRDSLAAGREDEDEDELCEQPLAHGVVTSNTRAAFGCGYGLPNLPSAASAPAVVGDGVRASLVSVMSGAYGGAAGSSTPSPSRKPAAAMRTAFGEPSKLGTPPTDSRLLAVAALERERARAGTPSPAYNMARDDARPSLPLRFRSMP
jgi:hypothetical protein